MGQGAAGLLFTSGTAATLGRDRRTLKRKKTTREPESLKRNAVDAANVPYPSEAW